MANSHPRKKAEDSPPGNLPRLRVSSCGIARRGIGFQPSICLALRALTHLKSATGQIRRGKPGAAPQGKIDFQEQAL